MTPGRRTGPPPALASARPRARGTLVIVTADREKSWRSFSGDAVGFLPTRGPPAHHEAEDRQQPEQGRAAQGEAGLRRHDDRKYQQIKENREAGQPRVPGDMERPDQVGPGLPEPEEPDKDH